MRKIIFSKYSNDRADKYKIRTDICVDEEGQRIVVKQPLTEAARTHIEGIYDSYIALSKRYENADVRVNRCQKEQERLEFEYIEGITLNEVLDRLIVEGKKEEFLKQIDRFMNIVNYGDDIEEFQPGMLFKEMFGDLDIPAGLKSSSISNIDMLFENIIVADTWTLIDYEWTVNFRVPNKYIIYRALSAYVNGLYETSTKGFAEIDLFQYCDISEDEQNLFRQMTDRFAEYVMNGHHTMKEIHGAMGQPEVDVRSLVRGIIEENGKLGVQIFFDMGQGIREEDSRFISCQFKCDHKFYLNIDLPENCTGLRIDPSMDYCLMRIDKVIIDDEECQYTTNGYKFNNNVFVFNTEDTQIYINHLKNKRKLEITGYILLADSDICEGIYDYAVDMEKKIHIIDERNVQLNQAVAALQDENEAIKGCYQQLKQEEEKMKNTKVWKAYEKYEKIIKRK